MVKIRLKIMCGGTFLNKHSDGGKHEGWNNPFGELIPVVGDIVELGGVYDDDQDIQTEGKLYEVIMRTFKAYTSYNNRYAKQECILEVKEIL